jgi:hypothetical protein
MAGQARSVLKAAMGTQGTNRAWATSGARSHNPSANHVRLGMHASRESRSIR